MTRSGWLRLLAIAGMAVVAAPAWSDDAADANAKQVAGLFMQSCLQYAGSKDALRNWAKKNGLNELNPDAKEVFLYGLPGVVFDATNRTGKFVLVSEDGGSCSAMAERAAAKSVVADLEQDLREAKIDFKVTSESDDADEKVLRHREYLVTQGQRQWLLLVSTVKDPAGGQAMLTINPY